MQPTAQHTLTLAPSTESQQQHIPLISESQKGVSFNNYAKLSERLTRCPGCHFNPNNNRHQPRFQRPLQGQSVNPSPLNTPTFPQLLKLKPIPTAYHIHTITAQLVISTNNLHRTRPAIDPRGPPYPRSDKFLPSARAPSSNRTMHWTGGNTSR